MPDRSVGGSIVVRGWESQPQGEGSQKFDAPLYSLAASPANAGRTGSTTGCEREKDDNAESNLSSGMPNFREPDAVKVARPVRWGECGNRPLTPGEHRMALRANRPLPWIGTAPCSYPTGAEVC